MTQSNDPNHRDRAGEGDLPHAERPVIDTPQPGARKEMPSSPPRTKFILAALALIALFFLAALIAGYV